MKMVFNIFNICLIISCLTELAYSQDYKSKNPDSYNASPVYVCNKLDNKEEYQECIKTIIKYQYFDGRAVFNCISFIKSSERLNCVRDLGNKVFFSADIRYCYITRRSEYSILDCLLSKSFDYNSQIENFPDMLDFLNNQLYSYNIKFKADETITDSLNDKMLNKKLVDDIRSILKVEKRDTLLSALKELNTPDLSILNEPSVYFSKSLILSYLGDNISALENIELTMQYASKDTTLSMTDMIRTRGDIYKSLERYEEAVADYMQVYEKDPEEYKDVLSHIVDIKIEHLDQKDSACSLMRTASQRGVDVFEAIRKYCN